MSFTDLVRRRALMSILSLIAASMLFPASNASAKPKQHVAYLRVWMAIVDKSAQYSLVSQASGATAATNLFGPAPGDYEMGPYMEIPPGQYEFVFKRLSGGSEIPLERERLQINEADFYTLVMKPDANGQPKLYAGNDTLTGDRGSLVVRVYNFVSGTELKITGPGGQQPVPPFADRLELRGFTSPALRAAFRSKDGDNLDLELTFDLKLSPVHSVVLLRDGYGDVFPRVTNDGVFLK